MLIEIEYWHVPQNSQVGCRNQLITGSDIHQGREHNQKVLTSNHSFARTPYYHSSPFQCLYKLDIGMNHLARLSDAINCGNMSHQTNGSYVKCFRRSVLETSTMHSQPHIKKTTSSYLYPSHLLPKIYIYYTNNHLQPLLMQLEEKKNLKNPLDWTYNCSVL